MKLLLSFLIVFLSTDVRACDCASTESLAEVQSSEYDFSEYVFLGEIAADNFSEENFLVVVKEVFKGDLNPGQIINFSNHLYCDPFIDTAGKWLIYAGAEDGVFKMNICGLSRNLKFPEKNRHFGKPPPILKSDSTKKEKKLNIKKYDRQQRNLAQTETKREIEELRKRVN